MLKIVFLSAQTLSEKSGVTFILNTPPQEGFQITILINYEGVYLRFVLRGGVWMFPYVPFFWRGPEPNWVAQSTDLGSESCFKTNRDEKSCLSSKIELLKVTDHDFLANSLCNLHQTYFTFKFPPPLLPRGAKQGGNIKVGGFFIRFWSKFLGACGGPDRGLYSFSMYLPAAGGKFWAFWALKTRFLKGNQWKSMPNLKIFACGAIWRHISRSQEGAKQGGNLKVGGI